MANHVLLNSEDHRTLRITSAHGADLGDAVMSSLVVPSEFRRVQNDYPILFRLTPQRDRFQALAMFGFEPGENLFLDGGAMGCTVSSARTADPAFPDRPPGDARRRQADPPRP